MAKLRMTNGQFDSAAEPAPGSNLPGLNEIMIGSSAILAGAQAAAKAGCLRAQAKDLEKKAEYYKSQWLSIDAAAANLTNKAKSQSFKILDDINSASAKMSLMRESFNNSFKQVQMIGIFAIVLVFILLLMKTFGLLGPLGHVLAWPFVTFYHAIKKA